MATELTMPQMGYDMQEGTILKWLKSEGESVQNGEPIAEIETDKAVVEFESYADGVVQAILVSAGTTVPVGEPIAVVGDAVEAAAPADAPAADAEQPAADEPAVADEPAEPPSAAIPMPAAAPIPVADDPAPEPAAPLRASPVARRIADERGVNIAEVVGTGPGGRVTRDDVVAHADAADAAAASAAEEVAPIADEVVAAVEEQVAPEPVAEVAEPADEVVEEEVAAIEEEQPEEEPVVADDEVVAEVEEVEEEVVEEEEQPEPEPVAEDAEPVDEVEPEPVVADDEPVPDVAEEVAAVAEQVESEPAAEVAEPDAADSDAAADGAIELSRMRRQIARVTLRSKQEKPHFYVTSEVDMTAAMGLRREINDALASEGARVTVNDMIIKACVDALKRYPKFNAFLDGDALRLNDSVNVGIAMAVEDGLLMPAIRGCEAMSLREIALASKDLADRAQNGTLRPDEYTGGTFGISNLGMFDVSTFVAIIQPPQSAIVAVGTVAKKPVVRGDEIVVRQVMNATISADHRVVDGAEGAQFLIEVKRRLESPLSLLL